MKLVVDANIVVSSLLKDSLNRKLLTDPRLDLCSPSFILEELIEHSEELRIRTKLSKQDFELLTKLMLSMLKISPKKDFELFIPEAKSKSPDIGDVEYIALALKQDCPLWSNDKALKKQSMVKVL